MNNTIWAYIGGLISTPLSSTLEDYIYVHLSHKLVEKRKDMEYLAKLNREKKYGVDRSHNFEDTVNENINHIMNNQKMLINELNKLSDQISEENLIKPRPEIISPLLDAVDVYGNEQSLSQLFASILLKSMDKDNFKIIRPCFVEMVKELSPIDALVLQRLKEKGGPIVNITEEAQVPRTIELAYRRLAKNYLGIEIDDAKEYDIRASLDNLTRMKIIDISYINPLADYDYNEFFDKPLLKKIKSDSKIHRVNIQKGHYEFTSLGMMFMSAITNNSSEEKS